MPPPAVVAIERRCPLEAHLSKQRARVAATLQLLRFRVEAPPELRVVAGHEVELHEDAGNEPALLRAWVEAVAVLVLPREVGSLLERVLESMVEAVILM